jgi:hypothetical protein
MTHPDLPQIARECAEKILIDFATPPDSAYEWKEYRVAYTALILAALTAALTAANAEAERWSRLAKSNARAANLTEDERFALYEENKRLREAAQAVVDRWEQPNWKDAGPTAEFIYRLRDALDKK